ncbi:MAG: carbohydrate ABC transporter permease [Desertimonas sp.]
MAMVSSGRRARIAAVVRYVILGVAAAIFLVPFYLLARSALMSRIDLMRPVWHWLPPSWEWSNLTDLFDNPEMPMARAMVNSTVVATVQTVGVIVISSMAGYGLARIPYRWSNVVLGIITATLLIPAAVTFVPSFVLISKLGWISTLQGLIVPGLFQAFATFLFRQNFVSFPREIEEAAMIDGCGPWRTFWRIVMPNSKGFVAAIATITFIGSWNAFLWPLVVGRSQDSWTVQVALSTLMTAQSVDFAQLFMGALVAVAPLLVMFVLLQRWIVQGVERTGIAGD